MSERLFTIHIGMPKTATTTIQDSLRSNCEALLSQLGVSYLPSFCGELSGHHELAWDLFVPKHPHRKIIDHKKVQRKISRVDKVLMSSEWFSRADLNGVRSLVERWALPEKREVVMVMRDCASDVRSRWSQNIKTGFMKDDIDSFIFNRYLSIYKTPVLQLQPWIENDFFPIVINYDSMAASSMGVDKFFLQSIYGDVVDWAAAKDSSNVSPEYEVVEMFRKIEFLFDRYYSTDDRSQSRHQILHDDVCKLLASEADSHLTYPSKKARKAIADLEERSIDDLELLGRIGRVVGF